MWQCPSPPPPSFPNGIEEEEEEESFFSFSCLAYLEPHSTQSDLPPEITLVMLSTASVNVPENCKKSH